MSLGHKIEVRTSVSQDLFNTIADEQIDGPSHLRNDTIIRKIHADGSSRLINNSPFGRIQNICGNLSRVKKYLSMGWKNSAVSLSDAENDVCIDVYITLVSVTLQSTSFETPATGGVLML